MRDPAQRSRMGEEAQRSERAFGPSPEARDTELVQTRRRLFSTGTQIF